MANVHFSEVTFRESSMTSIGCCSVRLTIYLYIFESFCQPVFAVVGCDELMLISSKVGVGDWIPQQLPRYIHSRLDRYSIGSCMRRTRTHKVMTAQSTLM